MILLLAAYVALIFVVSSRPRARPPVEFPHADKVAHVVEYGVLGWLLAGVLNHRARSRSSLWVLLFVLVGALVVGVLDELNQTRIPGRDGSVLDLGADAIGASLGGLLWLKARPRSSSKGE